MSRPLRALSLALVLIARAAAAQTANAPVEPAAESSNATPLPRRVDAGRPLVLPGLRFGFGAHVPVAAATPSDVRFVFDLHAGVGIYPARGEAGIVFVPELGYSHEASSTRGGNHFTPGFLVMLGSWLLSFGFAEHAVVGDARGTLALGVRSSLVAQVLATSLTLEVGHEFTSVGGEDRHDVRVTAAINPVPLIRAIVARNTRRAAAEPPPSPSP
ncbi:MAG: hypothetical protein U0325_27610 [Polyangiales bacterium]